MAVKVTELRKDFDGAAEAMALLEETNKKLEAADDVEELEKLSLLLENISFGEDIKDSDQDLEPNSRVQTDDRNTHRRRSGKYASQT